MNYNEELETSSFSCETEYSNRISTFREAINRQTENNSTIQFQELSKQHRYRIKHWQNFENRLKIILYTRIFRYWIGNLLLNKQYNFRS